MQVSEKIKLLDKVLPSTERIYLDYLTFYPNQSVGVDVLKRAWEVFFATHTEIDTQFYLHIPFCSRICTYCMYNTLETHSTKEIDDYIDALITYLEKFIDVFEGKIFQGLYIGGGTPSILTPQQIEKLFSFIFTHFTFDEKYYKTIEMNPSSTTLAKLETIRKYNFTRVSFGVQSFNKNTLDTENRTYISPERIKEIVEQAKQLGFQDINTDIILGLNSEQEKDILFSLRELKKVHPYSITVYTILKDMERSVIFQKDEASFYEAVKEIYANIENDSEILQDYNSYTWSNILGFKLVSRDHPGPLLDYEAHSKEQKSLFAVGHKAFGKIYSQGTYENTHFSKELIAHNFRKLTPELEMYMYVLKEFQFSLNKVDFERKFSKNFDEEFSQEIAYLLEQKVVQDTKETLSYIGDDAKIGYYGLLFLDLENILRFVKYRYHEKG